MNIYFSGIGGVGIGPLAMLSQDAGHTVSGSDIELSAMTEDLVKRGVKISDDQSGKFMAAVNQEKEIDLFVYTSGLPDDHPELKYAREYGITSVKRHELINQLIEYKNLKLIAVSGTHGKTTTTGILIWVFKKLGIPLSYSVGTRLSYGQSAKYDSDSKYFVYEADEFDKNMLKFDPFLAVITSLDYDHPDTYPDKKDYKEAFDDFVAKSESAIYWQNSGLKGGIAIKESSDKITLPGHNKANGTLALKALVQLEVASEDQIIEAINSFPGTERRFEKLTDNLYTDYAHHPKEISSTIAMARELNKPIVVIYQPHQNIRQHQLLKDGGYGNSFSGAKKVYWVPTYKSREDKSLRIIKPAELVKSTNNSEIFEVADMDSELQEKIRNHLDEGDLVIAMSAGDLDSWVRELADNI